MTKTMTTDTHHTTASLGGRFATGAAIVAIAAGIGWAIADQSGSASSTKPGPATATAHVRGHHSTEAIEVIRSANGTASPHTSADLGPAVLTPADQIGTESVLITPTNTKLASQTPANSRGPPVLTPAS